MAQTVENHKPESFASQFETTSGLSEWVGWLSIMLAVCAILLIAYLFNAIDYGMYTVITALGIGLLYKGYHDAKFLDTEMKLASEQVRILERVDDFESFLKEAPKSVFRSHIDNLYTISLSHTEINQDNLIEVLHSRLMAKNRVIELFSSILITLGLIGTILGLIIMMDKLSFTLSTMGEDGDLIRSLVQEGGALYGLGVAFITTLLGAVFGGVLLRVLTSVVDANIMRYTAHLAELTEVYVLPYMRSTARQSCETGNE